MHTICYLFPSHLLTSDLAGLVLAQLIGSSRHLPTSLALQLQYGHETASSY